MAGGSLLDMQDLGDGRYQATMANGATPIFTGDAGRQAFERLRKEESAVGPNALAKAPRQGSTVVEPARGDWVERAPQDANPEAAPKIPGKPLFQQASENPNAPISTAGTTAAPQQPGAPPPQANPGGPTRLPHAVEGVDPVTQKKIVGPGVMINGQMFVDRGPGTKGSPGGVTALGNQIMQGRADAAALAAPYQAEAAAASEAGRDLAIQQAENQKAFLEEQRTQAMLQAQNERDEQMAAQAHVADLQARADKAVEDHANSRMAEDSTADKFFQGLGAAMGAFGATLGKTPNFAAEFIQQLANNKMRKWEAETALKGQKANNLLSRYKDALGDMKLAKVAVKETLMRQASIEADQMAMSTKSEQIGNSWRAAASAAAAEGIKANAEKQEAFLLSFYGNKMLNRPATAGTPGGLVLATQQAYGEAQDQSVQLAKLAADKLAAEKGAGGGAAVATERTDKIAATAASIAASDEVMAELKRRGEPTLAGSDDPTAGVADRLFNQESNEKLNQATVTMAKGMQKGQSDADAEDARQRAIGGGSWRDRVQAAERGQRDMIGKLRTEIATLPDTQKVQILQQLPPAVRAKVLAQ